MQYKTTRHISAPPEEVFDRAADFGNAADFISGITKVELLTDGPIQQGSRFRETRKMFGKEATEEMEVTLLERPERYALGCESCGCKYHSEFTFKPQGSGTDVEVTFEATPLTFMAKVMGVIFRPMAKMCLKAIEKDVDDLKNSIEGNLGAKPEPA